MRKKRVIFTTLLIFLLVMGVSGCKKQETEEIIEVEETTEEESQEEELPEGMMYSYLTGEIISQEVGSTRPIAFQIDHEKAAMPQSGISYADVVYEVPVESNEVRLTIIMQDLTEIDRIGPLRSARSYHPGIVAEFNAIFFHAGRSDLALTYLDDERCTHMDGTESSGYAATYTASDHTGYHKTFTTPDLTLSRIESLGFETTISEDFTYKFLFNTSGEETLLSDGQDANKVTIGYTSNKPWFEYNEEDGLYYRYVYGEAHIDDANGEQVSVTNILVQYCTYNLEWDNNTKNIHTVGEGTGVYISAGKAISITWSKADYWENTHYYDENGDEIELNPGKTWVCIVLPSMTGEITIE